MKPYAHGIRQYLFGDQLIVMIKSWPGLSASTAWLYVTEFLNILIVNFVNDTLPL